MADHNHRPGGASPTTKLPKHERYFTVTPAFSTQDRTRGRLAGAQARIPWLRLRGKWLQDAGFDVDTRVRVRIMSGCLVLTLD